MAHRAIRLHRVANKNETVASLPPSLSTSVATAVTVVIVTKVRGQGREGKEFGRALYLP